MCRSDATSTCHPISFQALPQKLNPPGKISLSAHLMDYFADYPDRWLIFRGCANGVMPSRALPNKSKIEGEVLAHVDA